MEIIFLGTGGGRWMTIKQFLSTAGIRVHDSEKIHLDPGPGAILKMHEMGINPISTDLLLISHSHPDHYIDGEVIIEAMTRGMNKRNGMLIASKSAVSGYNGIGPCISDYHKSMLNELKEVKADEKINSKNFEIEAIKTEHSDETCVGFKISNGKAKICYSSDTQYFAGISELYKGVDVLILNTIRPSKMRIPWHLCSDDAVKILSRVKPWLCILTHFGIKMHYVAEKEAKKIEKTSGVKTIAAKDGMKIRV